MKRNGDSNRSRLSTHPLWKLVRSAVFVWSERPDQGKLKRIRTTQAPVDAQLANGFGYIESYMAAHGILSVPDGIREYLKMVARERGPRLKKINRTFEEDVRERVREKGQKYGTIDNRGRPVLEKESERSRYRRRKYGEQ